MGGLYAEPGSIFTGTAGLYVAVRPGYPAELLDYVAELAWEHYRGHVLDVGTGPGVVALGLAERGVRVVAVDPSEEMLGEAARQAARRGLERRVEWQWGTGEDLPPSLPPVGVVTIGDAFHWMNRPVVLERLAGRVLPGGCVALLSHRWAGFPKPSWDATVQRVRERHLGSRRHAGPTGEFSAPQKGSHEDVLRASAFKHLTHIAMDYTLSMTVDEVVAWQLSQAHSSPPVLGERREAWEAELREELGGLARQGQFTEVSQAHLVVGRRFW